MKAYTTENQIPYSHIFKQNSHFKKVELGTELETEDFNAVGMLYWDVKHAQSFEADSNMRLRLCNIKDIIQWVYLSLQGHFQKNTTDSRYKVHCLYNIHQQHRLLVLQQDHFHIKMYKKKSPLIIPSSTQSLWLNSIIHNNLTKPWSPDTHLH